MTFDKIRDEKLQYDMNREAAKISALSSGHIDKYEYLTGKEILPPVQSKVTEQAKFSYSPFGRTFENKKEITKKVLNNIINSIKELYKMDTIYEF